MARGLDRFVASAPAHANIIGEYADYAPNGGHILPVPLPLLTTVHVQTVPRGHSDEVIVSSTSFDEPPRARSLTSKRVGHWSDYVVGCLLEVPVKLPALKIEVESAIPMGCGLASSAALCVAVLRAVNGLADKDWIDEEIALMAYRAEHDYVGAPCGKIDQFVSSLGRPGHAMLLDTRTLRSRNYRLDPGISLTIVQSGARHDLTDDDLHKKRQQRVAECKEARDRLGVHSLCELGYKDLTRLSSLSGTVAKRAWHVVTENIRVAEFVRALKQGDVERQADLMLASHISQRDNFESSTPEIDALVESSKRFGVRGAKLLGGGGAIIALVPREQVSDWWAFVSHENPKSSLISTDVLQDGLPSLDNANYPVVGRASNCSNASSAHKLS